MNDDMHDMIRQGIEGAHRPAALPRGRGRQRGVGGGSAPVPRQGRLRSACTASRHRDRHRRRRRPRRRATRQPVRHGRRLDRRRGDLQRRLRHRLRDSSPPTSFRRSTRRSTAKVSPSTQIAQELQPRFVGGNPPDLIDNSGAQLDRLQHDHRPARGPQRRPRREEPRGHDDPRHPVRWRHEPGTLRRQARRAQLRRSPSTPSGTRAACSRRTAGPRRRRGTRPRTSAPRPRRRTSTCSSGARRRRPTTRRWPSTSAIKEGGDEVRLALENLEPGLLVAAGRAGGLHRDGARSSRRLLQARRRGHPVHRCPGPVEQRPGRPALPLGLVDRERDEGARPRPASR